MAERINSRTKRNKTGQHTNNPWTDYSTDKEGSELEESSAGLSPGLLAETFSSISWKNCNSNGWHD